MTNDQSRQFMGYPLFWELFYLKSCFVLKYLSNLTLILLHSQKLKLKMNVTLIDLSANGTLFTDAQADQEPYLNHHFSHDGKNIRKCWI